MYPPTEFYTPDSGVIWKLNKAIYGLRSSPKAWQAHLAETLQQLGLHRSTAEPNVYFTTSRDCYILVYVDDLMFLGVESTINKIFGAIQQHLMLRSTGTLTPGNTVAFLGRNITNMGDHYEISLADSYTTKLLEETSLSNCNPATTPGTSALKTATAEQEQKLNHEEHSAFRRAVGKLQWMTYTRPDISYATKELARSLQEPTTADQQKLKHLLRYIKGTEHYKQIIRPTIKVPESTVPDLNIYVDSDWAGCRVTRKSTTGFVITMLGATMAAEHKQQLHYQAQKQSCMQSTQEQQKHCILRDFVRNLPTSKRSTFESTQIHQVAKAWRHGSGHHAKRNTLNYDICSYNNLSHWTLCASLRSTQTTTQQTSSASMSQQRHYNDASTMLDCISNTINHNIQQQATTGSPTL